MVGSIIWEWSRCASGTPWSKWSKSVRQKLFHIRKPCIVLAATTSSSHNRAYFLAPMSLYWSMLPVKNILDFTGLIASPSWKRLSRRLLELETPWLKTLRIFFHTLLWEGIWHWNSQQWLLHLPWILRSVGSHQCIRLREHKSTRRLWTQRFVRYYQSLSWTFSNGIQFHEPGKSIWVSHSP